MNIQENEQGERLDGDWYQMTEEEQDEYAKWMEDSFWRQLKKDFIPEDYQPGG